MKMRIRKIGLLVVISIFLILSIKGKEAITYGFSADEHDEYLVQVLFGLEGNAVYKSFNDKQKNKVKMIEYASYLAIDQFGEKPKDESCWKFLKKQKVRNLPALKDFQLLNVGSNHGAYTHLGWNHKYDIDVARWDLRKKLLCSTVNAVFDFGFFNEWFGIISDQCDSFSALVYYIHILGDHVSDSYQNEKNIIPFAIVGANENNPDVFYELNTHLTILFENQKESYSYKALMLNLQTLAEEARELKADNSDALSSDERENEFKEMKRKLMDDILSVYVPELLKKTDYFKKIFY